MVQSVLQFGHCTTPEEGTSTVAKFWHRLPQALPIQYQPQPVSAGTGCEVQCIRCVLRVCSTHLHAFTRAHTHTHHMPEYTALITCPQGKYVHAVLTNRHHPHILLCSCMHAPQTQTYTQTYANTILHLHSCTAIPLTYMHNHMHMGTQTRIDTNTHEHTQNRCTASDCLDGAVIRII